MKRAGVEALAAATMGLIVTASMPQVTPLWGALHILVDQFADYGKNDSSLGELCSGQETGQKQIENLLITKLSRYS